MGISACSFTPPAVESQRVCRSWPAQVMPSRIWVMDHGWHSGIVVPSAVIQGTLPEVARHFRGYPYLEFGWGDRGYYQAQQPSLMMGLVAIVFPTASAIQVTGWRDSPDKQLMRSLSSDAVSSKLRSYCLSKEQMTSLTCFVSKSFLMREEGHVQNLSRSRVGGRRFYVSEGDYHLLNTCNNWTKKAVISADLTVGRGMAITSSALMQRLPQQNKAITGCDDLQ